MFVCDGIDALAMFTCKIMPADKTTLDQTGKTCSSTTPPNTKLAVGSRVEVNMSGNWLLGRVTFINKDGSYNVLLDSGKVVKNVKDKTKIRVASVCLTYCV